MKEYYFENGYVDIRQLEFGLMDERDYIQAHQGLVIPCHDVFIHYEGGILLVRRLNLPARDVLWPVGGRIKKGMTTEDSLRRKVLEEVNLELDEIIELGYGRTFFRTDPFGHGKGTDTINFEYFSKGKGSLVLDRLHGEPTIVLPDEYLRRYRNQLHPFVRDFMDLAIPLI